VKRREFITLLGGTVAWPVAAWAQQGAVPVIGYLSSGSPTNISSLSAFRRGLAEAGHFEGTTLAIEYRWAEDHYERLPDLAASLVNRRVSVIMTSGSPAALAAKAATSAIPIVFQSGVDPIAMGLVASLNRPGSNVTGITTLGSELGAKRLELLHEMIPAASEVALLVNPSNPDSGNLARNAQAAATAIGLKLRVLHASTEGEVDGAFASLLQFKSALVIGADPFFVSRGGLLGALALRHHIPTIFEFPEFTAAGGLMSYGSDLVDTFRLAGVYAGRILKGERPADMPVQQSTKVELIINMDTAKALGITVPLALLTRADEVIE
jgi:putative ABC transport system substrate-binding protein